MYVYVGIYSHYSILFVFTFLIAEGQNGTVHLTKIPFFTFRLTAIHLVLFHFSSLRVFNMEGERANVCGCLRELTHVLMVSLCDHDDNVLQDVLSAKNADQRLLEGRKDDDGRDLDPSKLLDLRVLVHHSQVGSVIGKSGDKIKDLREKHRMQIIKIYQEFAPRSTDRVLQLIGEPENVFACIEDIMETLEVWFPFPSVLYKKRQVNA